MTTTATTSPDAQQPLTAMDRCSRCNAQAYVEVLITSVELTLLFCAHHMKEHESKLLGSDNVLIVRDDRPRLAALESGQRDAGSA